MSSDTTNEDPKARSNFIRHIIDDDLAAGKYQQIHTRFPPEPNGYLHIGHAKSICLNFGLANDYEGQCNLRFDDTNPEKESQAYIDSIADDVRWLGFAWEGDKRFTSNYFEQLHSYAIELIEKGLAYVDFLSPEEASQYRGTLTEPGKNSPYRDTSADANLEHFAKMRAGDYAEGECVLRAKIDMSSSFMCMRDPILYRVRFFDHHQTGSAWNIYPMYDFAHCISDALEGVTHSLCTLEFQDNRRLYDWILEHISLENSQARPHQYEFSRLNLEYTVMSKRKLLQLVDGNHVSGWDDPRMPTISGLRRRGYTPESVVEFCARIGVTKQENQVEMSMLEACIREELNAEAPRAMAVLRPLKLVINNYPEETSEILTAPLHPQNDDMGTRQLSFSRTLYIDQDDFRMEANKKYKRLKMGKEVRLRNAYVVRADEVDTDDEGNITCVYCTYDPETLGKNPSDGRKVAGVIHWVDAATAVPATINNYDRLFNVPNPGQEDDMLASLNPESLITYHGFVEQNLEHAPLTQNWQFEREGYYCVDSGDSTADALVFNQTVALRDTWLSG